jgi:hypothetical protein
VIAVLPAVDVPKKAVTPNAPRTSLLVIDCVFPELFTIPAPSRVSPFPLVLIVKALAPGPKVIDSMVMLLESISEVCVEVLNVAVSPGLTGALGGAQLVPMFHTSESGLNSQTASTASTGVAVVTNSRSATMSAGIGVARMTGSFLAGWIFVLVCRVFIGTAAMDG